MKKNHHYEVMVYIRGGWLIRASISASTKAEAIAKAHKEYDIVSVYSVRYID